MIKALIGGLSGTILAYEWLRLAQQNGYKIKYCFKNARWQWVITLAFLQVATLLLYHFAKEIWWIACLLWCIVAVGYIFAKRKIPFVFTKRMARLFFVLLMENVVFSIWFVYLVPFSSGIFVVFALVLLHPLENVIVNFYCNKAKEKLKKQTVTKIAIVGSFGKTEIKHFACQLLPNCICTPNSVNTEKGVSAFINKTDFSPYEFAIFEMGAKKKGDIQKLCKMVAPDVGVFSGISPCHLQTFKSVENIIAEKSQLLRFLDKDSFCVMCWQQEYFEKYSTLGDCKKLVVNGGYLTCEDVCTKNGKSTFSLCYQGQRRQIECNLLGMGAILDLAMAIALCLGLGFDFDHLAKKATQVKSVPHRMQLIKGNGIYIIDDSYNANLEGVRFSCQALKGFDGQKFAITQGIAEGGKMSKTLNQQVGSLLSHVCDHLFVVGQNGKYILSGCDGLAKVCLCQSVEEATKKMHQLARDGDVVMFQNDLPD
ncbi:MAG: hypothetical protein J6R37_05065 [Clostridia bacterium]|nr:hypothetical protein [Clostridia bacterium]